MDPGTAATAADADATRPSATIFVYMLCADSVTPFYAAPEPSVVENPENGLFFAIMAT